MSKDKLRSCHRCVYYKTYLCNEIDDKYTCEHYTLKPLELQYVSSELLAESRKKELYKHFFYSVRMWLDMYSPYNSYDNQVWYYSLDQNKFLKRSTINKKEIGNWIKIDFNIYHFIYLQSKLGYDNPKGNIKLDGRYVNGDFVRDDLFINFEKFVVTTFEVFFNKNKTKKTPLKTPRHGAKKLF